MTDRIRTVVKNIEEWLEHNPGSGKDRQVQIVLTRGTAQEMVMALMKDGRYYCDRARNHIVDLAGCRTCMRSKADCVDCPYGRVLDFLRKGCDDEFVCEED